MSASPMREVSGSAVSSMHDCPLRWFLSREAGGDAASSTSQGFGRLVHVLAEGVAVGRLPDDAEVLRGCLDQVWQQLQVSAAVGASQSPGMSGSPRRGGGIS